MRKHLRFFFNDTATTEIYTLSLHDALPIFTQTVLESRMRRVLAEALSEHLGRDIRVAVQVEDSPAEPPAAPAPEVPTRRPWSAVEAQRAEEDRETRDRTDDGRSAFGAIGRASCRERV